MFRHPHSSHWRLSDQIGRLDGTTLLTCCCNACGHTIRFVQSGNAAHGFTLTTVNMIYETFAECPHCHVTMLNPNAETQPHYAQWVLVERRGSLCLFHCSLCGWTTTTQSASSVVEYPTAQECPQCYAVMQGVMMTGDAPSIDPHVQPTSDAPPITSPASNAPVPQRPYSLSFSKYEVKLLLEALVTANTSTDMYELQKRIAKEKLLHDTAVES